MRLVGLYMASLLAGAVATLLLLVAPQPYGGLASGVAVFVVFSCGRASKR